MDAKIESYLDSKGQIKAWPKKQAAKRLVLEYLASKFETGRDYSEHEVNALIGQHHTFQDHVFLRRLLFDYGLIDRDKDGSRYWRVEKKAGS